MLIIADKRLPAELKRRLSDFGTVVEFISRNIVYDALAGHPDIFFHKSGTKVLCAPNTPHEFIDILKDGGAEVIYGNKALGMKYPATVLYNALADDNKLFCNGKFIDNSIINLHAGKELVHLNQGYVACNMLIGSRSILSSDKGICKRTGAQYFEPSEIVLKGVNHGFIGGSCAVYENILLINGSLPFIKNRKILEAFAEENRLDIIELYDGPLIDGGGLLII